MPGIAASTSETCALGAAPNAVAAPENSFAWELTWAWISMPMTTSQSPVSRLMSLLVFVGAFISFLRVVREAMARQSIGVKVRRRDGRAAWRCAPLALRPPMLTRAGPVAGARGRIRDEDGSDLCG